MRDGARLTLAGGEIGQLQRARMLLGMAQAVRELGPGQASVSDIVARAGVSRRTFYEEFSGREDCLLAAIEEALRRAAERVIPAYRAQGEWLEAIRAGLIELLAFLDEDQTFGTLLIVDWLAAGDEALARRGRVVSAIVDALDQGREIARIGSLSRYTAEGVTGGVLAILHKRMLAGARRTLPLTGELMALIVMPYLGPQAVSRELRRPVARRARASSDGAETLTALDVRLTHRTLLVLGAIDRHPRASNRRIAELSGITDPGQISKLLARLAEQGLIQNMRANVDAPGKANAWKLSAQGARLARAAQNASSIKVSSAATASPGGARRKPED